MCPPSPALYGRNALRLESPPAPAEYAHTVYLSYLQFSQPAARFKHLAPNAEEIPWHEMLYADLLQGAAVIGALRHAAILLAPHRLDSIHSAVSQATGNCTRWNFPASSVTMLSSSGPR